MRDHSRRHGRTQGPALPTAPTQPIAQPATPSRVAAIATAPGCAFVTSREAFLLLDVLGEGGTSRAFLATPIGTAAFCGAEFSDIPPWDHPGTYPWYDPDDPLLTTFAQTLPVTVLKILTVDPHDSRYTAAFQRLRREASCYGSIHDPRLPRLVSAGVDPTPHLAIEYFVGETLREVMDLHHRHQPPERVRWRRAYGFIEKLATAIGVLHRHGIIHRDIKPENIIITQPPGLGEFPRLIDLGAAAFTSHAGIEGALGDAVRDPPERITVMTGLVSVTPGYAAPEQYYRDSEPTPAMDVYALGCLTYELFAGRPAFIEELPTAILAEMMKGAPPFDHPELSPRACADVHRVLTRALTARPEDRFGSTSLLTEALREVLDEEVRRVRRTPVLPAQSRPRNASGPQTIPMRDRRHPSGSRPAIAAANARGSSATVAIVFVIAIIAIMAATHLGVDGLRALFTE